MPSLGKQSRQRKKEEIKAALDDFHKIEGKKFSYVLSKSDLSDILRKVKRRSFYLRNFNFENVGRVSFKIVKWFLIIYVLGGAIFGTIDKYVSFLGKDSPIFHLGQLTSKPFSYVIKLVNWLAGRGK